MLLNAWRSRTTLDASVWLVVIVGSIAGGAAVAAEKPNIVFMLADNLGYGELGCFGGTDVPTPHVDSSRNSPVEHSHRCKRVRSGTQIGSDGFSFSRSRWVVRSTGGKRSPLLFTRVFRWLCFALD
jgi:hypothetical protein